METKIKFLDELPEKKRKQNHSKNAALREVLRANPGKWVELKRIPFSRKDYSSGLIAMVRHTPPWRGFEVERRRLVDEGAVVIYIRYVGELKE